VKEPSLNSVESDPVRAGGRGEHAIGLLGLLLAYWACCWPCGLAGQRALLASFFIFLCFSLVSFCFFPTLVLCLLFLFVHFMFKYLFVP
jgi:hypothetical protein